MWKPGYKKFIEDTFTIVNKSGERVPFILNPIQDKYQSEATSRDIILKARQQGFCLDRATRVLCDDITWKEIGDIAVGDTLVGVDEHPLKGQGRTMKKVTVLGKRSVYEEAIKLSFDTGVSVIATRQHRFLSRVRGGTKTGWMKVDTYKVGDVVRFVTTPWGESTLEDYWFGGMLDGEGTLRAKKSGGWEGKGLPGKRSGNAWATITKIESLGVREMIDIETSGKTFIAEGLVSHNSSVILARFAVDFLLKDNSYSVVMADSTENAQGLLDRVKQFVEDYALSQGIDTTKFLKYNSRRELVNNIIGSHYIIGTAGKHSFGRSKTITNLHFSEAAFYKDFDKLLAGALQAVVPDGYVVVETTANGFNLFKTLWDGAKGGENNFNPMFFNAKDFYTKEFLDSKKRELGRLYEQEYPDSPEVAFITSGDCYFDVEGLRKQLEYAKVLKPITFQMS